MNQEKSKRFHRVAEKRVNALLNSLRLLGQCSNRRLYEYSDEEARRMFLEIDKEMRRVKNLFNHRDAKRKFEF